MVREKFVAHESERRAFAVERAEFFHHLLPGKIRHELKRRIGMPGSARNYQRIDGAIADILASWHGRGKWSRRPLAVVRADRSFRFPDRAELSPQKMTAPTGFYGSSL